MDSMVNRYTANKRLRSDDAYTPDARPDMRPEYPTIVYTQILKKLFPDVPVVVGGHRGQYAPPDPLRLLARPRAPQHPGG